MPGIPALAGQHSFYAITQLFLFREGRRSNEAMTAVAKQMSDADLRVLPADRLAVIVLANLNGPAVQMISRSLMQIALHQQLPVPLLRAPPGPPPALPPEQISD